MLSKEKGFLFGLFKVESIILKMAIIVLIAVVIVPSVMYTFPIAKYVVAALLSFFVFELVMRALGNNVLTYIVSLILIYFIVFKYIYLSAGLMMIYFFIGAGFFSVLIWGTARFGKK